MDLKNILADQLKEKLQDKVEDFDSFMGEITLPEGEFYSSEELDQLKENIGKESAGKGAKTLIEMEVKALRDEFGLDFQGKTIKNLVIAATEKKASEYEGEAAEKLNEKNETIETLRNNISTIESDFTSKISNYERKLKDVDINYKLNAQVPKELPNGLNGSDVITLFRSNYNIDYDENGAFVKKGDDVLKDQKTQRNLSVDEAFSVFLDEKKLKGSSGGRGEGDAGVGGVTTLDNIKTTAEFNEYVKETKENPLDVLKKIRETNPDFILD